MERDGYISLQCDLLNILFLNLPPLGPLTFNIQVHNNIHDEVGRFCLSICQTITLTGGSVYFNS